MTHILSTVFGGSVVNPLVKCGKVVNPDPWSSRPCLCDQSLPGPDYEEYPVTTEPNSQYHP